VPGFTTQVNLPAVGLHVRITGTLVQNTFHAQWIEIHPVTSITVIPQTTAAMLGLLYLFLRSCFFMLSFHFIPQVSGGRHCTFDFTLLRRPLTHHLTKYYGSSKKYQIILFHIRLPRVKNCSTRRLRAAIFAHLILAKVGLSASLCAPHRPASLT